MQITRLSAVILIPLLSGTAAFAAPLETPPAAAPFALSLGITFAADAPGMGLETLAASVATGGTTVVTNAAAASSESFNGTSANGGASVGYQPLNSTVQGIGDGFASEVGTGHTFYPN